MDNKPKMYKAVIFDLDGTLLDTLTDLAAAGNAALEREGLPSYPTEAYRYFVGNGIPKLIERITTGQESKREAVHAAFLAYYRQHMRDATQPYPGIPAMLDALRRCASPGRGGYGAAMAAADPGEMGRLRAVAHGCRYLELSGRADFAAAFVEHMGFGSGGS